MSILQLRLESCLQTILQLESEIRENSDGVFDREFSSLKSFLSRIDQIQLDEEEIERLENTTTKVLAELAQCGVRESFYPGLLH